MAGPNEDIYVLSRVIDGDKSAYYGPAFRGTGSIPARIVENIGHVKVINDLVEGERQVCDIPDLDWKKSIRLLSFHTL